MSSSLFIRSSAFGSLRDRAFLRDPAGRGSRPHLLPVCHNGEDGLLARGSFTLHLRYTVAKPDGIEFCRTTGDDNPIHSEGEVVPGAYSAAKVLLPIEVLFPELEIADFAVRFNAISEYGGGLVSMIRCVPTDVGATFAAMTAHDGKSVIEVEVNARRIDPTAEVPVVGRREVNVDRVKTVRSFVASLGVAPHAWFRHGTQLGYFYPRSYLAALPSGAMVKKLRGEGGLLNKLSLEFVGGPVAITTKDDPTVEIERPKVRRTFNKILAAIGDGIRTYVRGTALVLSRDAAPATLLKPV